MEIGTWAQWASAIATTCAVLVALFGDWFRSILFKPQLQLLLESPDGVAASETKLADAAGKTLPDIRYYHLIARNRSKTRIAKDVRVYLARVETEAYVRTLDERVPLFLRHEAAFEPRREVGSPLEVDLFSVNDGRGEAPTLVFRVVRSPNTAQLVFRGPQVLRASVEADCSDGATVRILINIRWDGQWSKDQMDQHLSVSAVV